MTTTQSEQVIDLLAGSDLSAKQFYLAKLSTAADRTCLLAGSADYAIGTIVNKPTSGAEAQIQVGGVAKVVLGGTVTRGDPLTPDANGKAITQTGQNPVIGYALDSGSASDIRPILLIARPVSTGVAGSILSLPVTLAGLSNATYSTFVPGFAFTIKKVTYMPAVVASTSNKLATLTVKISGTGMTGGVLTLTTVACGTLATNVAGSAVSAANTGTATDSIDLVGSSVTTFVEGSGVVLIELQ